MWLPVGAKKIRRLLSTTGLWPIEGSPNEGAGGMIIWGIFWGAVLGSWLGGYGDFGPFLGGILGFFAGLSLRWAIRSAIRTELQAHAAKATAPPTRAPQATAVAEDRPIAAPSVAQGPAPSAPPLRPAASDNPRDADDTFWTGELTSQGLPRVPSSAPSSAPLAARTDAPAAPAEPRKTAHWPPRTGSWAATPSCAWAW
jgi:hypothetical protein